MSGKRKILIMELWGLGDLTLAVPFIRKALKESEVYLLGKPNAKELLHPSLPSLRFLYFEAPWTAHRKKYRFWRWNWSGIFSMLARVRELNFDVVVSVRKDPRDHFLAWLFNARERIGFGIYASNAFLTKSLKPFHQHRMEDWMQVADKLGYRIDNQSEPVLRRSGYLTLRVQEVLARIEKPLLVVHMGSQIAVRRWPSKYFGALIQELRKLYNFHLLLIPDPDGYGTDCDWLADSTFSKLTTRELVGLLGSADLLICNDSGPAHISAGCGRPVITIFGPGDPKCFRPWGENHKVVIRDICPQRPCFDYCRYPEAYCLTRLTPAMVLPEVIEHIESMVSRGILPAAIRKSPSPSSNLAANLSA